MEWLTDIVDHPWLLLIAVVIAAPVLYQYFQWFFGYGAGLQEDALRAAEPDWCALLRDRCWEGQRAELKITCLAVLVIGVVAAMYKIGMLVFF